MRAAASDVGNGAQRSRRRPALGTAVAAGCEVICPLADQFYGDRRLARLHAIWLSRRRPAQRSQTRQNRDNDPRLSGRA
jgi:hypothetical protein